jgi:hypothetical protein
VLERSGRFFIRYDAGAHVEILREDEISENEANKAAASIDGVEEVLLAIQARLRKMGIDPHISNIKDI